MLGILFLLSLKCVALPTTEEKKLYWTRADVVLDGRAIVFDLRDVEDLPFEKECVTLPHSTILFRDEGYLDDYREAVHNSKEDYLSELGQKRISFGIETWKEWPDSDLVVGELKDLWNHLQKKYEDINNNTRACHVRMRCKSTQQQETEGRNRLAKNEL
mmetsp:Transcript_1673/g.3899  ORF Transcript_1673/g.3899 Transcript_1673/m.3899 type:complete len:159 (+) Transcript_1673:229-705(+)